MEAILLMYKFKDNLKQRNKLWTKNTFIEIWKQTEKNASLLQIIKKLNKINPDSSIEKYLTLYIYLHFAYNNGWLKYTSKKYFYLWRNIKNKAVFPRVSQPHGNDITGEPNINHLQIKIQLFLYQTLYFYHFVCDFKHKSYIFHMIWNNSEM